MPSIFAGAGTNFFLTSTTTPPATNDAAGYAALTFIPIGCISSLGSFGKTYNAATIDCLVDGATHTLKGTLSRGTLEVTVALDDTSAAFTALETAVADKSTGLYHFKIVLPNKQASAGKDAVRYFSGRVMSNVENVTGSNDVVTQTISISIETNLVKVNSTAS